MADPYIGEIRIFAGSFAPRDWRFCNGDLLPIAQYNVLFAILGTQYGGDGRTTFALPNLTARVPIGQGAGPGLRPRSMGEAGGSSSVTMLVNQMPAHSHVPMGVAEPADDDSPTGGIWAIAVDPDYGDEFPSYAPTPNLPMSPAALLPAGSSHPHNNMQPSLGLNYIICLDGEFPARE